MKKNTGEETALPKTMKPAARRAPSTPNVKKLRNVAESTGQGTLKMLTEDVVTDLGFAELAQSAAAWENTSKSKIDVAATGFIRIASRDAVLVLKGYQSFKADDEITARDALVIEVRECSMSRTESPPLPYTKFAVLDTPLALLGDPNPSVGFCGYEAGTLERPPVNKSKMRRTRVLLT